MAFRAIFRVSSRVGLAAGAVGIYCSYGLWKNADETIENYELLKKDVDALLESAPIVKDVASDVGKYTSSTIQPITNKMADFRNEWLSFDIPWISNSNGLVKPVWNKVVGASCYFMAHSPEILSDLANSAYKKASEYMNEPPAHHQHKVTITTNIPESQIQASSIQKSTSA